jgi:hypothetical protein
MTPRGKHPKMGWITRNTDPHRFTGDSHDPG